MPQRPGTRPQGAAALRTSLVTVAALTALLVVSSAAPAGARAPMALGISTPGGRTAVAVENAVNAFSASVGGQQPALWSIWSQWGDRGANAGCQPNAGTCSFPSEAVAKLHDMGITPVIWWEPWNPANWSTGKYERYKRILAGKHDGYIRAWAQAAREAGEAALGAGQPHTIVLRLAHEANGDWFPWGIGRFDNTVKNFKAAWRHVWRLFKEEGALPHVDFLWSVTKQICRRCNPFAQVYPGGKFVDYAGITAFNWGTYQSNTWKPMVKVLTGGVSDLMKVTKRPIIVAELASHFKGGNKATWIRKGYPATYRKWSRVKAVLYLNTKVGGFTHPDWRLVKPNDGSALAAYADIASRAKFKGDLQ